MPLAPQTTRGSRESRIKDSIDGQFHPILREGPGGGPFSRGKNGALGGKIGEK